MIDDTDRRDLADLAMRLDTITTDYGADADLIAASLVFEVCVPDLEEPDTGPLYECNYNSLQRNSPHHIAGLLAATAKHITS